MLGSLGDGLERHAELAVRRGEKVFGLRALGQDPRVPELGTSVGDEIDERRPHVGRLWLEDRGCERRRLRLAVVGDDARDVESRVAEIHFGAPEVGAVQAEDDLRP